MAFYNSTDIRYAFFPLTATWQTSALLHFQRVGFIRADQIPANVRCGRLVRKLRGLPHTGLHYQVSFDWMPSITLSRLNDLELKISFMHYLQEVCENC